MTDVSMELDGFVNDLLPEIISLRHEIHADPELQFCEFRTRARVVSRLEAVGYVFKEPVAGTDAVAELAGPPGSPMIGIRADMDALPIEEATGAPYASRNAGVMHACGHDGHTSILVGTALALAKMKDRLAFGVRFIFQPAEEIECGGRLLAERGVCDDLVSVYALHGWPGSPVGEIQCRAGTFFAAADFFSIRVMGVGGHGAMPELARSPMPGMAAVIQRVDALHRQVSEASGSVVSICSARAGGAANNVIPEHAELEGTARYLSSEERVPIEEGLQQICREVSEETGLEVTCGYRRVYDVPAVNDAAAVDRVAVATEMAGGSYQTAPGPTMGAEDFAFYLERVPGAMFWLGVGVDYPKLHQPDYNFNDGVIGLGIKTFCNLALDASGE